MFIVRILRYIRGYVIFVMSGSFVERFLNLCARSGISVWDLTPLDKRWEACTNAHDYKRMRPLTKPTGVRIKIKSKHGAPFIVRKYRKRVGLFAGIFLFLIIPIIMSSFIWSIEVKGNEKIETEKILESLAEFGVKPGVYRRSLDARELERRMILAIDDLSWIAINIQGSKVIVEVKERTPPPAVIDDENKPANVIASRSGQIKRMEVYDGQPLVKIGDSVLEGDIIVSGITEDKRGNTLIQQARALVIAWVPESVNISVPLENITRVPVGKPVTDRYIHLFSVDVPLSFHKKPEGLVDLTSETKPLSVLGIQLPVNVRTEIRQYQEERHEQYTEKQAKEKALEKLEQYEKETFAKFSIIEKSVTGYLDHQQFVIRADYTLEMDISKLSEIMLN